MRNEEALDSSIGVTRFDLDVLIHKYKNFGRKSVQCLMFIEVKTRRADLPMAQKDTMYILDQVLRNTINHRKKAWHHDCKSAVFSIANNRRIWIKLYGGHYLRFDKTSPEDSNEILWDKKQITKDQLLQILRFEIDPDTLDEINWKKIYGEQLDLF
jgi:hypothetical protein